MCVYVYVYCSIVYVCTCICACVHMYVCVCVCVHVCMCMREERERKGKPPLLSYHCFLLQYDRKYESSDEQTERLGIFIKNLQYIMQANSMEGRSFQCETTDQQWLMTSFPHPTPITPALTLTHHPSHHCYVYHTLSPFSLLLPTHPPSSSPPILPPPVVGLNAYSDLTFEEFKDRYLISEPQVRLNVFTLVVSAPFVCPWRVSRFKYPSYMIQ